MDGWTDKIISTDKTALAYMHRALKRTAFFTSVKCWLLFCTSHVSVVRDWQRAPCQPAAQRQWAVTVHVLLDSVSLLVTSSGTCITDDHHHCSNNCTHFSIFLNEAFQWLMRHFHTIGNKPNTGLLHKFITYYYCWKNNRNCSKHVPNIVEIDQNM